MTPPTDDTPRPDVPALQALLDGDTFSAWVKALALRVVDAPALGELRLAMPVTPALVHSGGVVCGQALMAAADTAMVLAIAHHLGGLQPMTTVQLQTSFLRPLAGNGPSVQLTARVLRGGRRLVFGEILLHDSAERLAAHATTTYALL